MPAAAVTTRLGRLLGTLAALAGLAAVVALFVPLAVLNPGRTSAQPMSALTSSSLSSALALTDDAAVRLASYAAIAAVILLLVFSIQLSARVGDRSGARPRSATFVVAAGAMIAALFAVDWGLALALGEVALARDLEDALESYFVWGWWRGQLSGALFLSLMVVVAACGVHGMVAPRLARWSTLVLAAVLAIVTVQGLGGLGLLAGGVWVAGLSVAMAIATAFPLSETERIAASPGTG